MWSKLFLATLLPFFCMLVLLGLPLVMIFGPTPTPPLVAPFTAPTVPDRPPAAPDPVTGVTLPTTAAPYDCTTTQFGQPPDGAVQTIPAIVTLLETHATYDRTPHSEMLLSHLPDGVDQSAPTNGNCMSTPGHVAPSVSTIAIQHHCVEENSTPHLHVHQPLASANMEPKDYYPQDHLTLCKVIKDTSERDNLWDTLNLGEDPCVFDECPFDLSVKALPTSTVSRNDEQPTFYGSTESLPTLATSCNGDEPPAVLGACCPQEFHGLPLW